ncbi:MAG: hypothetical protein ACR2G2_03910 [Pseudonocardia sp.]
MQWWKVAGLAGVAVLWRPRWRWPARSVNATPTPDEVRARLCERAAEAGVSPAGASTVEGEART